MMFLTGINNSFVWSKYSHCLWYTKRKQYAFIGKQHTSWRFLSFLIITYIAKRFVPICFAGSRLIRQIGLLQTFHPLFILYPSTLLQNTANFIYIVGSMQDKLAKYWMCWQGSNLFIKKHIIFFAQNTCLFVYL